MAVVDGYVAGLGDYDGDEVLDATGRYVVPGFVDAHMHLESTKLLVDEFARLVLPLGTTTVVADPHEIANVLGTDGVHWLLDVCGDLPLDVFFMASSCVPASVFESPRRPLSPGDLEGLLRRRRVIGLAEMMNFPGVVSGDEHELAKLRLPGAEHVDGHAPGVLGKHAERLRRGRDLLRPRGLHARGRARAAAGRDVAADPRGLGGAEPAGAAAARAGARHRADRLLHRRPRARAHRRGRAHQLDGARRGRGRDRAGGRARAGDPEPGDLARPAPPRRDRARLPGRPAAAPGPRVVRARDGAQARPPGRRDRAAGRAGVGQAHRPRPPRRRARLHDPLGGRAGTRDRRDPGPDRDRGARRGAARRGRPRGRGKRPREDRGGRAPPRHGPHGRRARARVRPPVGRARLDLRPRRAQHRRRRDGGPRHGPRDRAPDRDRRRRGRRRGPRRARRAGAAGRGPDLGGAARRGGRGEPRLHRGGGEARLHAALAVPDDVLPRALRDPVAEDHRPRARGRRPLRAGAAPA